MNEIIGTPLDLNGAKFDLLLVLLEVVADQNIMVRSEMICAFFYLACFLITMWHCLITTLQDAMGRVG
jgi:hypothetical protein